MFKIIYEVVKGGQGGSRAVKASQGWSRPVKGGQGQSRVVKVVKGGLRFPASPEYEILIIILQMIV